MTATPTVLLCRGCQSPVEPDDLRCAICAMVTPPRTTRAPPNEREARARILRCDGCGAALAFSAEAGAPRCAFCAAVMHVEQPSDPVEVAEHVLPFGVSPPEAQMALRRWLGSLGFFRPSDLATSATVEKLRALYWCCWLVEADALVSWSADSDHGSGRSNWAPHAGRTEMRFERLAVPASRGLTLDECARLTEGYNVSALIPARSFPDGAHVEQFDVQRSAARSIIVRAIERTASARLVERRVIPGARFRNVHVAVLLRSLRTRRVALSAYVLAYRYKGQSYRAIVHGQDVTYTFGKAPYSVGKIALVVVGALFVLAALVALVARLSSR